MDNKSRRLASRLERGVRSTMSKFQVSGAWEGGAAICCLGSAAIAQVGAGVRGGLLCYAVCSCPPHDTAWGL
jgi:hypothetical protein